LNLCPQNQYCSFCGKPRTSEVCFIPENSTFVSRERNEIGEYKNSKEEFLLILHILSLQETVEVPENGILSEWFGGFSKRMTAEFCDEEFFKDKQTKPISLAPKLKKVLESRFSRKLGSEEEKHDSLEGILILEERGKDFFEQEEKKQEETLRSLKAQKSNSTWYCDSSLQRNEKRSKIFF
jgi:hypothetical protein